MASSTHLHFDSNIGRQKPESIRNTATTCPFCDRSQLSDILDEQGNIIWLANKYATLVDTVQTVIIETDVCDSELSEYEPSHLHRLFKFAFDKWQEFRNREEFKSVIFYKNHGPFSGGTIRHPHMQIVGLKHIDADKDLSDAQFAGIEVVQHGNVTLNISTHPRVGFFEFNVVTQDLTALNKVADLTQIAAHYALNHFHKQCNSYNIFFYHHGGGWKIKVVPRFVTSPLYVGYGIPQVSNRIYDVADEIRKRYFS